MSNTVIPISGATSWVYDPTRNTIDYATTDGVLHGYSLSTGAEMMRIQVGGTPGQLAISPDGQELLIANTALMVTSSPTAVQKTYVDDITRVNLTTLAADHLQFTPVSFEGGVEGVAIAADGTALVSTDYQGSGWTPLREFQVGAATPTFTTVPNLTTVTNGTEFISSENGREVLIEQGNISSGPLSVFTIDGDRISASTELYSVGATGYQAGEGAISAATGLVADVLYGGVYVFDTNLKPVANLSTYAQPNGVAGAAFSQDGHELFLWQPQAGQVLVLDTTSWTQVGQIATTTSSVQFTIFHNPYHVQLIEGGQVLALSDGSKIELAPLAGQQPGTGQVISTLSGVAFLAGSGDDTVTGSDVGSNDIRGYFGNDVITGGSQHNVINGNQGADTIIGRSLAGDTVFGGQGDDLINIGASSAHNNVNGNLGNDHVLGGSGGDTLYGGQGDDVIVGGSGADWISGDRGNDTETGGAGADTFHTSFSAGVDQVADFNYAEGDRVSVDPGTIYTVVQSGPNTIIDMGAGNQMVLLNVNHALLPSDWIGTA